MWLLKYSPSHFPTEMILEALCTHRPSLLPIEWLSEALGLAQRGRQRPLRAGNLVKLGHLEEVKVVTRFSFRLKLLTYRSLTWTTIINHGVRPLTGQNNTAE